MSFWGIEIMNWKWQEGENKGWQFKRPGTANALKWFSSFLPSKNPFLTDLSALESLCICAEPLSAEEHSGTCSRVNLKSLHKPGHELRIYAKLTTCCTTVWGKINSAEQMVFHGSQLIFAGFLIEEHQGPPECSLKTIECYRESEEMPLIMPSFHSQSFLKPFSGIKHLEGRGAVRMGTRHFPLHCYFTAGRLCFYRSFCGRKNMNSCDTCVHGK